MRKFFRSWIVVLWIGLFTNGGTNDSVISDKEPDFNDFIEKILKSNKFDQLVETIAEKTAEKIHNLRINTTKKESKEKLHKSRKHVFGLKNVTEVKLTSNTSQKLMLKYKLFTKNLEQQTYRRRTKERITTA